MSDLVVVTFDDEADAEHALQTVRGVAKDGELHLTDTAVVMKDDDGVLHVKNEASSGAETGAVIGGAIGLLTSFLFPVAGVVVGAAAGAYIGSRFANDAVDGQFVDDVAKKMQPGKSALFLMVDSADHSALRAALEPYKGELLQTTLPEDFKESLEEALRQ